MRTLSRVMRIRVTKAFHDEISELSKLEGKPMATLMLPWLHRNLRRALRAARLAATKPIRRRRRRV